MEEERTLYERLQQGLEIADRKFKKETEPQKYALTDGDAKEN